MTQDLCLMIFPQKLNEEKNSIFISVFYWKLYKITSKHVDSSQMSGDRISYEIVCKDSYFFFGKFRCTISESDKQLCIWTLVLKSATNDHLSCIHISQI